MTIDLRLGDCLEVLKTIPDNSIDSIVTDPPYGLSFMGKKWDYDVPSVEVWTECLRVLKPGGHLLSFAGSRTYHRMAVRIEDAGFEIRDQIMWVYGSGFPKSHNIGKAIDKIEGNEREVVGDKPYRSKDIAKQKTSGGDYRKHNTIQLQETKGNGDWEGWGTALKPAHEPIVMARKPLSEKSIAENVLKHGTGGINIDGSRITIGEGDKTSAGHRTCNIFETEKISGGNGSPDYETHEGGRFPANIIFDEEAGQLLDEQSGIGKGQKNPKVQKGSKRYGENQFTNGGMMVKDGWVSSTYDDKGGASRFFYCPKAAKKDRNEGLDDFELKEPQALQFAKDGSFKENKTSKSGIQQRLPRANNHPTVKPTDLMRYLINLITPPNGTILDPFMGSGSTGKAAVRCGLNFIGIEREQEYMDISQARIEHERNKPVQTKLFDGKE